MILYRVEDAETSKMWDEGAIRNSGTRIKSAIQNETFSEEVLQKGLLFFPDYMDAVAFSLLQKRFGNPSIFCIEVPDELIDFDCLNLQRYDLKPLDDGWFEHIFEGMYDPDDLRELVKLAKEPRAALEVLIPVEKLGGTVTEDNRRILDYPVYKIDDEAIKDAKRFFAGTFVENTYYCYKLFDKIKQYGIFTFDVNGRGYEAKGHDFDLKKVDVSLREAFLRDVIEVIHNELSSPEIISEQAKRFKPETI